VCWPAVVGFRKNDHQRLIAPKQLAEKEPMTPISTWVSKTDVIRYLRCPYAFYLIDRGLVAFEDSVTEMQVRLIEQGVEFQAVVESKAAPLPIDASTLPKVFAQESIRLFQLPLFKNPKLRIFGIPDGIDTAEGALIPVEIKSHKTVQRTDELELAFYWMLLDPHRTKKVSPRGCLILRRDGVEKQEEIEIRPHRFEQVRGLLREIREARLHGVPPRICGCPVCSGVMEEEIERTTAAKKDLTRITGIGRTFAQRLEEMGINNYEGLLGVDSAYVVENFRIQGSFISPAQVDCWKHHAISYSTSSPVVFGDPLLLGDRFIAIDLEYGPGPLIWLIGVCIAKPAGYEYRALWVDSPAQEKSNLEQLAEVVTSNPSFPVITWNGNGADLPELRKAARRLDFKQLPEIVEARHLDLLLHTRRTTRFPIPQMGLDDVASYFTIQRVSQISGGFEAQRLYQEYRSSQDEGRRKAIKDNLIEYNRDDLESLVGVAQRIAGLKNSSQTSM
jgi:predicted RecB family nuclease